MSYDKCQSNVDIKLSLCFSSVQDVATEVSTCLKLYLGTQVRTTISAFHDLCTPVSRFAVYLDSSVVRRDRASSPKSAQTVSFDQRSSVEIPGRFSVKRAGTIMQFILADIRSRDQPDGDPKKLGALSQPGTERGSPRLTYDGLYHLRMNSAISGWPLVTGPIINYRRGFIRLTIRGANCFRLDGSDSRNRRILRVTCANLSVINPYGKFQRRSPFLASFVTFFPVTKFLSDFYPVISSDSLSAIRLDLVCRAARIAQFRGIMQASVHRRTITQLEYRHYAFVVGNNSQFSRGRNGNRINHAILYNAIEIQGRENAAVTIDTPVVISVSTGLIIGRHPDLSISRNTAISWRLLAGFAVAKPTNRAAVSVLYLYNNLAPED